MASCASCGSMILFGGVKRDGLSYCNAECAGRAERDVIAQGIPEDVLREHVGRVHAGPCPQCQGPGPVDIHTSHWVWSALVFTRFGSTPRLSCRGCAIWANLRHLATSAVVGWWGFPWGLMMTPIQIVRNLGAVAFPVSPHEPSPQLVAACRADLAEHVRRQASAPGVGAA